MTTLELWDEQGNLFSVVDQPWPAQSALYTTSATTPVGTPANTEQVYAASGSSTTGHDTRGFGCGHSGIALYFAEFQQRHLCDS